MAEKKFRSVEEATSALVAYARERGLIGEDDITYVTNMLFDALKYQPTGAFIPKVGEARASEHTRKPSLESILGALLDYAVEHELIDGGIASRDLFDTRLMGCVTPRPSEVTREFWRRYEESPKAATDYLYRLALDSDYIRSYRIIKDRKWVTKTPYGKLDITINLSKPEKDPKAIAAALKKKSGDEPYPRCQLCPENVGYAGRLDHPARETIRLIPLTLAGEKWYLQYSPYVYYNEHCIVLSERHVPMKINTTTFVRLLEFIEKFPHYTVGSNADLPIVGGSILTHEHYQGGCYEFAMARADLREKISFAGFDDVEAGIVNWPMSVIRLDAADPARLVTLADKILTAWRRYSDESVGVLAADRASPWRGLRARPGAAQQPHHRRVPPGHLPSASGASSHQEGEHRAYRGHGPGCAAGAPPGRDEPSEAGHSLRRGPRSGSRDRRARRVGPRDPEEASRVRARERRQHRRSRPRRAHGHYRGGDRPGVCAGARAVRRLCRHRGRPRGLWALYRERALGADDSGRAAGAVPEKGDP